MFQVGDCMRWVVCAFRAVDAIDGSTLALAFTKLSMDSCTAMDHDGQMCNSPVNSNVPLGQI
eukprot:600107-Rhodomonas_salina.1